ncbi:hypothetical protein [Clostridium sp.]|uniref:hypothetical protein n=1 Tax=Clostridium sp. TaxID=1506 RepID=UPI00284CD3EF|nr:hypothetical protein [Clostridium sp.]MDR3597306.1 hypothetical protein [Clostridium sp.]
MEIMYVKYVNGQRHSIIKEGENIIMNNSKIIPFDSINKVKENRNTPYSNNIQQKNDSKSSDKINEEITNFFFNAIHKNYLSNRKK